MREIEKTENLLKGNKLDFDRKRERNKPRRVAKPLRVVIRVTSWRRVHLLRGHFSLQSIHVPSEVSDASLFIGDKTTMMLHLACIRPHSGTREPRPPPRRAASGDFPVSPSEEPPDAVL